MSETVNISKDRYEELLACERFRDKRRFSDAFKKDIAEAEAAIARGEYVIAKDDKEMKAIFDRL